MKQCGGAKGVTYRDKFRETALKTATPLGNYCTSAIRDQAQNKSD